MSLGELFQQVDGPAFKVYRDQLLADSGNPSDPIEIMMIEQIALAHLNIGRLQFRSATAQTVDAAKAYGGMATQLLGEFRRTALALQAFRCAAYRGVNPVVLEAPRSATNTALEIAPEPGPPNIELVSTETVSDEQFTIPFPTEEPESGRGGKTEPGEGTRAHG